MDHAWLMRMFDQRIDDKRFLNLIKQWLKARIKEPDGHYHKPESGRLGNGAFYHDNLIEERWYEDKAEV